MSQRSEKCEKCGHWLPRNGHCLICRVRKNRETRFVRKQRRTVAAKIAKPVTPKKPKTLALPVLAPPTNVVAIEEALRPQVRSDCLEGGVNAQRPCLWVSCRHNLYLDVTRRGIMLLANPSIVPEDADPRYSCSLDVAGRGSHVLDRIGEILGLTRERVRQIELSALTKLRSDYALRTHADEDAWEWDDV